MVRRLVMEARRGLGSVPGPTHKLATIRPSTRNEFQRKEYRDRSILHLAGATYHRFLPGFGIQPGCPTMLATPPFSWGISAESYAWQLLRPLTRVWPRNLPENSPDRV